MATRSREREHAHPETPLHALNPLFISKTRAPTLPRPHLARPRLIAALRQSSRRRVTLVCAPPGAGKTTLVADFVRSPSHHYTWYTVDDLDDSATALLHGLSIALGCNTTHSVDRLGYLAQIVERLERGAEQSLLIVDDVHRLTDVCASQALSDLLRYLPQSARVILVGRAVPAGLQRILDWMAVHGQLARLLWDQFQLSDDERTQALAVFKSGSSGAWILGYAQPEGLNLRRYLQSEVLTPLGAPTVERLSRLSILPSFNVGLAAAIGQVTDRDAQQMLEQVTSETPLVEHLGDETYRFSETAREILLGLLTPGEVADARRAAAHALRPVAPRQSAESFLLCGDQREAARSLARLPLSEWLTQSASAAHDLLRQMDVDEIAEFPRLLLARAWTMIAWAGDTNETTAVLARIDPRQIDSELSFWYQYVTARACIATGKIPAAVNAYTSLKAILDLIRQDPAMPPATVAGMLCRAAIVERYLGGERRAVSTAESGLSLAELSPETTRAERQLLHHVLGAFLVLDGDYQAADEHFSAALALASDPADIALRSAIWHCEAGVARCRGEFIRALSFLEQALREPLIPPREQALLTLQAAHALADVEDFRAAAKRYRSVASMVHEGDRDGCFSRALSGLSVCCAFLGLAVEAEANLAQLRRLDGPGARYDTLVAEGVYALVRDEAGRAAEKFASAREIQDTIGGFQDTWQAVLLQAQALLRQTKPAAAEKVIASYLAAHADRVLPAVGLWVLRPVESILTALNERGINPSIGALTKLLAADPTAPKLRHAVAAIDRATAAQIGRTEVRLFGRPELIVDGKEAAWPYGLRHKAIELFWYSALHLDGFGREEVLADLFPDRDANVAGRVLSVTISDLRSALTQILGVPGDILLARRPDGNYHLDLNATPEGIAVETRALRELAEDLRKNRRLRPPAAVPEIFRGELVAGLNAEWIEPIRRYWMSVYLRTLGTLAQRYAGEGLLQQAIRCRELVLQVDPTIESAHADLMRLYHAAGDNQAVESQMWLYTRISRDELDAEPNEALEELYRNLVVVPSNPPIQ